MWWAESMIVYWPMNYQVVLQIAKLNLTLFKYL